MAEDVQKNANPTQPGAPPETPRAQLESLIERAAAKDALKDFDSAAEIYSEATELQARLNGELSLDNADLLFAYGKALYNVAVSKSDVLGSKVAGETKSQPSASAQETATMSGENPIERAIASGLAPKGAVADNAPSGSAENKPFFQFTGDENFDDSDSEEEDNGQEANNADDDDDFANAFEVLDLARILYHKKLTSIDDESGKGKSTDLSPTLRHLKERLADTYDLQAEISLEAERFMDAVADLKTALGLRQALFSIEDPSIAECHYKLSLALEFASVQKGNDDLEGEENQDQRGQIDEEMRKDAAFQMEKAIESCRVRMAQEQAKLDCESSRDEDKTTAMKRKIANVKEIIADMEQRLVDIRSRPVSFEDDEKGEAVLKGLLGQMMGQSPSEKQAKLDTVTKNANDLSAFVKRKPADGQASHRNDLPHKRLAHEGSPEGNAKRTRKGSNTVD
ncbi:hypothetical protein P170DRAFT_405634 [Aspergillus steynii IBT 23096]|uniref:Tetratricopeptide SHNi-TPR domain-containing protein n=1 Tax=Aspergillus steynii IBT 23096 TaxID=1392250 RepID=A0A2I2GCC4_9EURO|nr:uncharacterized protein P170DRAFT_405634 [Aspergillus steynii IBT 23096]PLB50497.1 hypothetical protein P170DRAFT_405634 [Aspergillus steynii IBT 23096]